MKYTITKTDISKFNTHMRATGKSENTLQKYNRDITDFQSYLSENDMKLSKVAVDAYVKYLLDNEYSTSSVNSVISAINTFCGFVDRSDIHCAYLKNVVSVNKPKEYLSTDEYKRLIDVAVENREFWLASFIQTIGNMDIRLNELQYLTVESLIDGYITVIRAKKSSRILIPQQVIGILNEYVGFVKLENGIIFRNRLGNVYDRSNICKALKRLAVEADVDASKVSPRNLKRQLEKDIYTISYNGMNS